jgi:hypothetical protein
MIDATSAPASHDPQPTKRRRTEVPIVSLLSDEDEIHVVSSTTARPPRRALVIARHMNAPPSSTVNWFREPGPVDYREIIDTEAAGLFEGGNSSAHAVAQLRPLNSRGYTHSVQQLPHRKRGLHVHSHVTGLKVDDDDDDDEAVANAIAQTAHKFMPPLRRATIQDDSPQQYTRHPRSQNYDVFVTTQTRLEAYEGPPLPASVDLSTRLPAQPPEHLETFRQAIPISPTGPPPWHSGADRRLEHDRYGEDVNVQDLDVRQDAETQTRIDAHQLGAELALQRRRNRLALQTRHEELALQQQQEHRLLQRRIAAHHAQHLAAEDAHRLVQQRAAVQLRHDQLALRRLAVNGAHHIAAEKAPRIRRQQAATQQRQDQLALHRLVTHREHQAVVPLAGGQVIDQTVDRLRGGQVIYHRQIPRAMTVSDGDDGDDDDDYVEAMRAGSRALVPKNITSGGGLWKDVSLEHLIGLMQHCLPWADRAEVAKLVSDQKGSLAASALWDTAVILANKYPRPTEDNRIPPVARSFGLVEEAVTAALAARVEAYARQHELQAELDAIELPPDIEEGGLDCGLCAERHRVKDTVSCQRPSGGHPHVLCRQCFSSYVTITHLEHASHTDLASVPCCSHKTESCDGVYDVVQVRANITTFKCFVTDEKHDARIGREALDEVLKEGNAIELECECGYVGILEKARCIQCPKCRKKMCTLCLGHYHESPNCPPSKQMSRLLKDPNTARCPGCGQGISRISGCNHLTCLCGTHFCVICSKKYDGHQYLHAECEQVPHVMLPYVVGPPLRLEYGDRDQHAVANICAGTMRAVRNAARNATRDAALTAAQHAGPPAFVRTVRGRGRRRGVEGRPRYEEPPQRPHIP